MTESPKLKHKWVPIEASLHGWTGECSVCGAATNNAFLADLYSCPGFRPEPPVQRTLTIVDAPTPPPASRWSLNVAILAVMLLIVAFLALYLVVRP